MRKSIFFMAVIAGLMGSTGALAGSIQVNGNLHDWGIDPSNWTTTMPGVQSTIEDQHDSYLNPGYGGQAYDAEAMYALVEGNTLFIALATGHKPDTANKPKSNSYGAGDFAIDFGKDGSYEVGINIKPAWDSFGAQGGVYNNIQWNYGLWDDGAVPGYAKSQHPTSIASGDLVGMVDDLAVSPGHRGYGAWVDDWHYFYEVGLSLDLLKDAGWNGKDAFNIHWTQNCANDSIIVDPPSQAASVPEPGTLALLPVGMIGLAALRRRKSA
jgi:hypothetical protein